MAYVKHCSYMHLNVGDMVSVPGLDSPFVVKEKESVSAVDLFHDQLNGVPKGQCLYYYLGFKPDDDHFLKPLPEAIKAVRKEGRENVLH